MTIRRKTKPEDEKAFHLRMPRDTWLLLKKAALIKEVTMGEIVVELVEKQRKKLTKRFSEIGDLGDLE